MEFINPFANNTLTATYQINTPMFLGGADGCADTITPQSFKGLMRFWWRAWQWQHAKGSDDSEKLADLHHKEALLFGSSAPKPNTKDKKELYGQGAFTLIIRHEELKTDNENTQSKFKYLAYGMQFQKANPEKDTEERLARAALLSSQAFTVQLTLTSNDDEQTQQLTDLLDLIGLVGSLGAKSRKGFGSIQKKDDFLSPAAYQEKVQALFNASVECPPFTAFSKESIVATGIQKKGDSTALLRFLQGHYLKELEQMSGAFPQARQKEGMKDKRQLLGLPIKDINDKDRHSAPVFFHIHQQQQDPKSYFLAILYLPSTWLFEKTTIDEKKGLAAVKNYVNNIAQTTQN